MSWRHGRPDEVVAYLRFASNEAGHLLHVAGFRIVEPSLRLHRDLPLGRIENAVNAAPHTWFELHNKLGEELPGGDPIEYFRVKGMFEKARTSRLMLKRPAGRRLDDHFYAEVARAYADAVAVGLNPRKTLAADSGTPADTVARWIRTARQRGKLSEAQPGKASGVVTVQGTPTDG